MNRGDIRLKTLDYFGAAEDFSKVIELDPNHPVGYAVRGEAYLGLNHFDKAIPDLDRAIETAIENSYLYLTRGRAHYGAGDLESAIKDFDRALELDPCRVDYYLPMQAAVEAYTDLIELEPDNAEGYLKRAHVRAKMGNPDRSMYDFQRALDREPNLATAYYFRAYFKAHYPVKNQLVPDETLYENVNQDLSKAKELEYVIPREYSGECRQVIAEFRQRQP